MSEGSNRTLLLVLAFYALLIAFVLIGWLGAGWMGDETSIALLVFVCATAPIGALLTRTGGGGGADTTAPLAADLKRAADAMQTLSHESGLSEAAKRVLHRRQERDLLRREIERDIGDRDYDAAMILVKELAERFGYRTDAEEFRSRIELARAETIDQQVNDAIRGFDDLLAAQRWTDALAEAGRISRVFPDSPRVDGLQNRVVTSRERYKQDLERQFLEAAQREETDRAMDLLKALDSYITPEEAERLQEVARGVIGRARQNLGVRFKLLVQDRSWRDALEVAEEIMREFPNTRMAQEVREMIDTLRERAAKMTEQTQQV